MPPRLGGVAGCQLPCAKSGNVPSGIYTRRRTSSGAHERVASLTVGSLVTYVGAIWPALGLGARRIAPIGAPPMAGKNGQFARCSPGRILNI